jgi:two-component system invasion response regulator UvrY
MQNTSILILDSHALVAQTLQAIYESKEGFDVIAFTDKPSEALQLALACRPHIILAGMYMPVADGLHLTRALFSVSVHSGIIVLGWTPYHDFAIQFLQAGARGYLSRTSSPEELIHSTKFVREGGVFVTDEVKKSNFLSRADLNSRLLRLSPTEIEIIRLMRKGFTNQQIAGIMGLTAKNIEVQQYKILQRLELRNTETMLDHLNDPSFVI